MGIVEDFIAPPTSNYRQPDLPTWSPNRAAPSLSLSSPRIACTAPVRRSPIGTSAVWIDPPEARVMFS